jgi:serine/threonine protein kinase
VARRRFIREARAAAGIKHVNVITIYAVEESQNCPFLVMEYVGGCSLRDHIRRHRHLEPLEVVRLSHGIAAGLAAAHSQGVIHRDIKPSNIMLEEGGVRVKITDFGLARAAIDNVDLTSQGTMVGTAAYMSPEQVSGNTLSILNQTPTDEMSEVLRTSRLPSRSWRRWLRWAVPAAAVVLIAALGALLLWPRGHEDL